MQKQMVTGLESASPAALNGGFLRPRFPDSLRLSWMFQAQDSMRHDPDRAQSTFYSPVCTTPKSLHSVYK